MYGTTKMFEQRQFVGHFVLDSQKPKIHLGNKAYGK